MGVITYCTNDNNVLKILGSNIDFLKSDFMNIVIVMLKACINHEFHDFPSLQYMLLHLAVSCGRRNLWDTM